MCLCLSLTTKYIKKTLRWIIFFSSFYTRLDTTTLFLSFFLSLFAAYLLRLFLVYQTVVFICLWLIQNVSEFIYFFHIYKIRRGAKLFSLMSNCTPIWYMIQFLCTQHYCSNAQINKTKCVIFSVHIIKPSSGTCPRIIYLTLTGAKHFFF